MKISIFYLMTPLFLEWVISGFVYAIFPTLGNVGVLEITAISAVFTSIAIYALYSNELKLAEYGKLSNVDFKNLLIIALSTSLGFNGIIFFSGLAKISAGYQAVAEGIYHSQIVIQILTTCILSPLMEELVYRGMLYRRMRESVSIVPSVIVSALVFGAMHGNIVQFVYAFFVGCILAICYEYHGTLKVSIILHVIINAISLLATWSGLLIWLSNNWIIYAIITVPCVVISGKKSWKMLQKH